MNENKRLKEIGENTNLSEGIISRVLIDKEGKFLVDILNKGTKDTLNWHGCVRKNLKAGKKQFTTSRAILFQI